jgi:hypothetical protein
MLNILEFCLHSASDNEGSNICIRRLSMNNAHHNTYSTTMMRIRSGQSPPMFIPVMPSMTYASPCGDYLDYDLENVPLSLSFEAREGQMLVQAYITSRNPECTFRNNHEANIAMEKNYFLKENLHNIHMSSLSAEGDSLFCMDL